MFGGTRRKPPPDEPFSHGPDCPHQDLQPEWGFQIGPARWERTCCFTEIRYVVSGGIDPNSALAEPSWKAHRHSPDCAAAEVQAVVRVERREGGTGWRSTCSVCTTQWVYFWDADKTDRQGRPIRREANCWYQYELAQALVSTAG
jgi:hypothetical protein